MKPHHILIVPIALLGFVSCRTVTPETHSHTTMKQGVPGGQVVQTHMVRATVTSVDPATRKITLVTPQGRKYHVTAGPEVANFNQIHNGDQFKVTLTEELVVRMAKKGENTMSGEATTVGLAPVGAKPGVVMANTIKRTATVTEIDTMNRKVTLKFGDGSSHKIMVRDDIDLAQHHTGEKVTILSAEVLAVKIEKP